MIVERRPRIALTLGDPAGIGTEIAVTAALDPAITAACQPLLFGSPDVVEREMRRRDSSIAWSVIAAGDERPARRGEILVAATAGPEAVVPYGEISVAGGEAAVSAVRSAVAATLSGDADAICTAPLNKESMRLAGYTFDGHTEMLAEFTGTTDVTMLLIGEHLRVAHLTTHTAIRRVPDKVTPERLRFVIRAAEQMVRLCGIAAPRVAVAGLNPHAGEHGLFGDEEDVTMRPVIDELRRSGVDVHGPVSGDAVFIDALNGQWDLVIAAYHDQGHIPVKLIERDHAVNVTGGLPIIRTSVDHGTAFDIAGRGTASAVNMKAALRLAAQLSRIGFGASNDDRSPS